MSEITRKQLSVLIDHAKEIMEQTEELQAQLREVIDQAKRDRLERRLPKPRPLRNKKR